MRHARIEVLGLAALWTAAWLLVSCSGEGTAGGQPCAPGTLQCSGGKVEQCLGTGDGWETVALCAQDESCMEGICLANACEPGTRLCAGDVVWECLADGPSWKRSVCAEGNQCLFGECVECVSNPGCPDGQVCEQGQCVEPGTSGVDIVSAALPDGIVSLPYTAALQATLGTEPYSWTVASGELPAGVTLDASSGAITGTPLAAVDSTFVAKVTTADGAVDTQAFSLRVREGIEIITESNLPVTEEGYPYETQLAAARGLPPYAWMITDGALPAGLDLYADGRIAGVPSEVGSFPFTVRAFDNLQPPRDATKPMNLTVKIAPLVILGDPEFNFFVTKIIVLQVIFPYLPYSEKLKAQGGLKPYLWEEQPVPPLLATLLKFAGVDTSEWGVPDGLSLSQDGTLSGSKSSVSDAVTVTVPVVNIPVTGYFFYASVTDSQIPAKTQGAVFVIPTIPLAQP